MLTALFLNALALGGGYFIGWMRAKEKYNKGVPFVIVSEKSLKDLKVEYEKHKHNPDATFIFEGERLLVSYAKYLIEYLEFEFESIKKN